MVQYHASISFWFSITFQYNLSVGLGDALELILLLDGVADGAAIGGVDQLVGQALGDRFDDPEGGLACAQQPDGLV